MPEIIKPKCPHCGSTSLSKDERRGELICNKCGFVMEEDEIDTSPEWRAFDTDQQSKRTRTGAPLTFSVDYEEPIIIREGDDVRIVKIGEFVDKIIEANKSKVVKQKPLEIVFLGNSSIQTVSFDNEYNIDFHNITEVSRHPASEIYEVEIEGGEKIRVTGSHSLFTVADANVVPTKVDALKKGDFLVAPKVLPSGNINMEIDLIEKFSKISGLHKNIYLRHISDKGFFEKLRARSSEIGVQKESIKHWARHCTVPLHVLGNIGISWRMNGERIGISSSDAELAPKMKITKDFCRLLGLYVAEGSSLAHRLQFSFGSHEREYIDFVKGAVKSIFSLDAKEYAHDTTTQVEINSSLLSILFSEVIEAGKNAKEKRVPPMVFSLPRKMKLAFIRGYIDGDGHVWQRGGRDIQVGASSASGELIRDLSMLYRQLGIHASFARAIIPSHKIEKTGQLLPEFIAYMLRITNPDTAEKFGFVKSVPPRQRKGAIEDLIPAPLKYKKEWKSRDRIRIGRELAARIAKKHNDEKLLRLAEAPFMFLRAKSIKKVKSSNGYAYDITVPGCENFVCSALFAKNTKHDKGISTEIGKSSGELYKVPVKKRAQYYRLRKWNKRLTKSKDRNLSYSLSELARQISYLGLPKSVHEEVGRLYEKAVTKGLVRGRSMESIITALIYAVAREQRSPRTLSELAAASGIEKREIGRAYRYVARELSIRILPASAEEYVPRFASLLGLSGSVQALAKDILKSAVDEEVTSGKGPTGIAAAALYIAAVLKGERRTQRDIADVVGVTEVTIRNRYKDLVRKLGIEEEVERKAAEVEKKYAEASKKG